MSIREHRPPTVLAAWLDAVWERAPGAGGPNRILPDGCIDVVFSSHLGARLVGANTVAGAWDAVRRRLMAPVDRLAQACDVAGVMVARRPAPHRRGRPGPFDLFGAFRNLRDLS